MSHKSVITNDGLTLAVASHGDPSRPTIVAVHGYPDDHTVWDGVVEDLAESYHVVTYDVRGAGASDRPADTAGYRLDQLADDLDAVIDAVSPDEPVHLLAHDWGAIQSWHAVTDPTRNHRIASYTSISGPSLDHAGAWMRRAQGPAGLRDTLTQLAHSWYIGFFQLPIVPELAWRSGLFGGFLGRREHIPTPDINDGVNGVGLYRANMLPRLGSPRPQPTDVPVQVIAPTGDAYVGTPMQTSVGAFAPDLAVRTVPGRHWFPRDRPDAVARYVRELVESVRTGQVAPALRRARLRAAPDAGRWTGRLVVVTGAGSGIGRETVLAFARLGAEVVAADRDLATATETVEATADLAGRAFPYQVDVGDAAAMEQFAKWVEAEHGVPDLVVNNAGIGMAGPFTDTTVEDWQRIVDVNLMGVVYGCRLFAEQMRANGEGGQIVNTASAAAFTPHKSLAAYAATKAAVLMLSECLRAELAEYGIGVTAICPGFVHTNITATTRFVGADEATEARKQATTTAAYAKRNYTPDKVAAQIVRAAERNPALQPVTPEAHVTLAAYRLTPGLVRAIARRDIGPS